ATDVPALATSPAKRRLCWNMRRFRCVPSKGILAREPAEAGPVVHRLDRRPGMVGLLQRRGSGDGSPATSVLPGRGLRRPRRGARMQGSVVGPYELLDPLGHGGMGVVYRARDRRSERLVALKTVRVPSEGQLQSIRREISALARLRHPGIVRILEHGL